MSWKIEVSESFFDRFDFIRTYIGFGFFTWWGLWSGANGNVWANISGFITSLGGII